MSKGLTAWVMLGATVGLIGFDIAAALLDPQGDTISQLIRDWAWRWHVLPYAWGVLTGHLFFHRDAPVLPVGIALLVLGGCIWVFAQIFAEANLTPVVPICVGVVMGWWFWPQEARDV